MRETIRGHNGRQLNVHTSGIVVALSASSWSPPCCRRSPTSSGSSTRRPARRSRSRGVQRPRAVPGRPIRRTALGERRPARQSGRDDRRFLLFSFRRRSPSSPRSRPDRVRVRPVRTRRDGPDTGPFRRASRSRVRTQGRRRQPRERPLGERWTPIRPGLAATGASIAGLVVRIKAAGIAAVGTDWSSPPSA
jgi:hypothetical protein